MRVSQTTYNAVTGQPEETTAYLFDNQNHTGYAQVLEQTVRDAAQQVVKQLAFTLGLDVTAQASLPGGAAALPGAAAVVHHLLYDAHGSTRALADALAQIAQRYTYDAYGTHLNPTVNGNTNYFATAASALTQLLYSGEFTQAFPGVTGAMQYLRARWYEPGSGRFMRVDPARGQLLKPTSFHKYLYTTANPIAFTDPSGLVPAIRDYILMLTGGYSVSGTSGIIGMHLSATRAMTASDLFSRKSSRGLGGKDITRHINNLTTNFLPSFKRLKHEEKKAILDEMIGKSGRTYVDAWDIYELAWQKDVFDVEGSNFSGTVSVNGNVFRAEEVNYVLWGLVLSAAEDEGLYSGGLALAQALVYAHRASYPLLATRQFSRTGSDAEFSFEMADLNAIGAFGRSEWTKAGWDFAKTGSLSIPSSVAYELLQAGPEYHRHDLLHIHLGSSEKVRRDWTISGR